MALDYARLMRKHVALEQRHTALKARLAAMERGGVCIWCGEALDLTGKDMESAVEWARQHDAQCPDNPLRARLAEAERLLVETRKVLIPALQILVNNGWVCGSDGKWTRVTDSADVAQPDPKPWVARTWGGTRVIAEERFAEAWEAQDALAGWMQAGARATRVSVDHEPRATSTVSEVQK